MEKINTIAAFSAGCIGGYLVNQWLSTPSVSLSAATQKYSRNSDLPPSDKLEQMVARKLEEYDVGYWNGFLRDKETATSLPVEVDTTFRAWEEFASALPNLGATGNIRGIVHKLPMLNLDSLFALNDNALIWRAHVILTIAVQMYVFEPKSPIAEKVPANLAVPAAAIAKHLGIEPIITHFSLMVYNVKKIHRDRPMTADNLAVVTPLLGGMDETWFVTATAQVEYAGAAALRAVVRLKLLTNQSSGVLNVDSSLDPILLSGLQDILLSMRSMNTSLKQMKERCDPHMFYHRIRPIIGGWAENGLLFQGVSDEKSKLSGASAAQSALFSILDISFGVSHGGEGGDFLLKMRSYMPQLARDFIAYIADESKGSKLVTMAKSSSNPKVKSLFNQCIAELSRFRKIHLGIVAKYIIQPAKRVTNSTAAIDPVNKDEEDMVPKSSEQGVKGTGGTDVIDFLKPTLLETKRAAIAGRQDTN